MKFQEAKAIMADPDAAFTDKCLATVVIMSSDEVEFADLLACLDAGGIMAELAATKLHTITGRKADNEPVGVYLGRKDWEMYLADWQASKTS